MKSADKAKLRPYRPSKKEDDFIHDGISFLNMTAPFISNVHYAEMTVRYTLDIPFAATDSHSVFFNPVACIDAGWNIENMAFVIAHEDFHYILGDLIAGQGWRAMGHVIIDNQGRTLPYDHDLMNKAMDYRINAMLIDGKIGTMPKEGLYDRNISAIGMESCIEIYAKLWKKREAEMKSGGQGPGDPGGFDEHIEPSDEMVEQEAGMGAVKRAMVIAAAVQAAEAAGMGDVPAALKRIIGEILEPKVKWQDHLKASMQRAVGEPSKDWSKPDKRMISRPDGQRIFFGRRVKYGCGTIVVADDTSGSTFSYQDMFFGEMAGIVGDLNPQELIVIRCDAAVHGVDTLDQPEDLNDFREKINEEGIGGGGGTDFRPVFDYIKEHNIEPDMVVYLTDTYGVFPSSEPSYPVIWASIINNPTVPFGHVVEIKE